MAGLSSSASAGAQLANSGGEQQSIQVKNLEAQGLSEQQAERVVKNEGVPQPTPVPSIQQNILAEESQLRSGWNKPQTQQPQAQQSDTQSQNYVKLSNGDLIDKTAFNALSASDQALLMSLGVSGFNAQKNTQLQQFQANNVKLNDGSYVSKTDFDKLSPADQASLKQLGVTKFNAQQTQLQQTFLVNNVKLDDGTYIAKTDFDKLSAADQALLIKLGVAGFNAQQGSSSQIPQEFLSQNTQIAGGQYVSSSFYNELTPTAQAILKTQGITAFNNWVAGSPTTVTVPAAGTSTPDNDPTHQMALVTYTNGQTATMQALAVQAMAAEGGLAAYNIISWTPIPTPPIVTPPTQQTVTTNAVPTLAQVYTDSGWKPNFDPATNGGNPYAGMPSWYQQVESAGFVPSPANGVTPPSQTYVPLTAGVTYPTNVGQTAFDAGIKAGTIPAGSIYQGYNPITGQINISGAAPANSVKLNDGTYVSQADFSKLTPTQQQQLITLGIAGFNSLAQTQVSTQTATPTYNFTSWASSLTQGLTVGSPAYITNQTLLNIYNEAGGGLTGYNAVVKDQVSSLNTYLQDVYTNAYNLALKSNPDTVAASNAGLAAVNTAQTTAMQTLTDDGYVVNGQIDWNAVNNKLVLTTQTKSGVTQAIDTTLLLAAGFTPAQIADKFGQASTTLKSTLAITPATTINPITGKSQVTPITKVPIGISLITANQGTYAQATVALTQTIYAQGLVNYNPTQSAIVELTNRGYNQAIIDAAQKQVNATEKANQAIVNGIASNSFTKAQWASLETAIHDSGYLSNFSNWVYDVAGLVDADSQKAVLAEWNRLSPLEQAQVANLFAQDQYSTNYFAEYAKDWAEIAKSEGILGSATIGLITNETTPIAKKITGQTVSADDIKAAIISGAIDVSMALGVGEVVVGAERGIGALMGALSSEIPIGIGAALVPSTISTIANPEVSVGSKALAVGSEVALIGGGAFGLSKVGVEPEIAGTVAKTAEGTEGAVNTLEQAVNIEKNTIGIKDNAAQFIVNTKTVISNLGDVPAETAQKIAVLYDNLANVADKLADTYASIATYLRQDLPVAISSKLIDASTLIENTIDKIQIGWDYVNSPLFAQQALEYATNLVTKAVDNAGNAIATATKYIATNYPDKMIQIGQNVATVGFNALNNAGEMVAKITQYVGENYPDAVINGVQNIANQVNMGFITAGEGLAKITQFIAETYPDTVSDAISKIYTSALQGVDNAGNAIAIATKYVADTYPETVINVVSNGIKASADAIGTAGDALTTATKYIAENYPDAVIKGFENSVQVVRDAGTALENATVSSTKFLAETLPDAEIKAFQDAVDAWNDAYASIKLGIENLPDTARQVVQNSVDTFNDAVDNMKNRIEYYKISAQTTTQELKFAVQMEEIAKPLRDALDKVTSMDELQALKDSDWYKDAMSKYQDLLGQRIQYNETQLSQLAPMAGRLTSLELGLEDTIRSLLLDTQKMQLNINYQRLMDRLDDMVKPIVTGDVDPIIKKLLLVQMDDILDNPEITKVDLSTNAATSLDKLMDKINDNPEVLSDAEIQQKIIDMKAYLTKLTEQQEAKATIDDVVNRLKNDLKSGQAESQGTVSDVETYMKAAESLKNNEMLANQSLFDKINDYIKNPQDFVKSNENNLQDVIDKLTEKSSNGELSAEQQELWQQISSDIQSLSQLMDSEDSAFDMAKIASRIQDNMNKLINSEPTINVENAIDGKLSELGYSDSDIAQLTDKEKLDIVSNNKPPMTSMSGHGNVAKTPTGEPLLEDGYTRLYRGVGKGGAVPIGQEDLKGQWFTTDRAVAMRYAWLKGGGVNYIDIPTEDLSKYVVDTSTLIGGNKWLNGTHLLPSDINENAKSLISADDVPEPPDVGSASKGTTPPDNPLDGSGGSSKAPTETTPEPSSEKTPTQEPQREPEPQKETSVATEVKPETKVEEETVTKTPEELEEMMKDKEPVKEVQPEVKPETKVEEETVTKTPEELEEMMKDKEPVKEVQPESKPETSRQPSTTTMPQIQQPESEPYWTWVWENGAVVFKQVTPQKLQQLTMTQELDDEKALEAQRERDAAEQLAKRLGISVDKALELLSNNAVQLANQSQVKQMTKVQVMEQVMTKEPQPQPQPEKIPAPNLIKSPEIVKIPQPDIAKIPQPDVVKIPQPDVNKIPQPDTYKPPITQVDTKPPPPIVIPPPVNITATDIPDEWKKKGVPKGTIEYRQGRKWVVIPPPYSDESKMYLDRPLPGTTKFATGKGSAYKTLQVIGGKPEKDVDIDVGWANIHISTKGALKMSFKGGKEAVNERWSAEKERMEEYDKQSYEDLPEESVRGRVQKAEPPRGLQKMLLPQYSSRGLKVYAVNGDWIRNTYADESIGDRLGIDFVSGGHAFVYWKIIPENEIWLEKTLSPTDRKAVLLHEIEERDVMKNKKIEYSEAHNDYANKVEAKARQNYDKVDEMLYEALAKYQNKPKEKPPAYQDKDEDTVVIPSYVRRKKGVITKQVQQQDDETKIADRYYLGHKSPVTASITPT
jgi:hypothetical protein